MTTEYSHSALQRFKERGKIFLVDYSKACAAEVILSILRDERPGSFLMVAENVNSAKDYAKKLKEALGEVTVVTSLGEFEEVLGFKPDDFTHLNSVARVLPTKRGNVIISATDKNGAALLNKELCRNSSTSGSFSGKSNSPYCISDVLADAGYEFVAIDGVYSLFSLKENLSGAAAGSYDLLTLFGNSYYSETAKSYKRLERLALSADKRIVISEVALKGEVVNLYAALRLVNSDFSAVKMRKAMASDRFAEYCDSVNTAFSYYCGDDSCISECMQKLRSNKGFVPTDLESMNRYFVNGLSYISDEEKLLLCAKSAIKLYFSGSNPGIDAIVDTLMTTTDYITGCILDMFFGDALKERMESSIANTHLTKLGSSDYSTLYDILMEYGGVYHYLTGKDSETKVVRTVRDNSGYEYFVRRRSKYMRTDGFTYSAIGNGSSGAYKCTEIVNLATGHDPALSLDWPLLVIVETNADKAADALKRTFGESVTVSTDLYELDKHGEGEKFVSVVSAEDFRSAAVDLKFGSALFYDALPDVILLKRLVNKALRFGAKNVLVFSSYDDLSAHVMDYWQNILFDGEKYLPFENSTIAMKENVYESYRDAVRRIESEYSLLGTIVRGGQYEDVKEFSSRFGKLLLDYTLMAKVPEETIMTDVEYLAKTGAHFEAVFANTCTVGDEGDRIVRKKLYYDRIGEGKHAKTTVMSDDFERTTIFFNACAKRLTLGCDFLKCSCADCPDRESFLKNDLNALMINTNKFFEKTLEYDAKMEEDKINGGGTVSTISIDYGDEEEDDDLVASQIVVWKKDAEEALKSIEYAGKKTHGTFVCDYAYAECVRDAVYKTYRKMIRKYYITLRDLFDSSTKKAIDAYRSSTERTETPRDDK